MLESIFERCAIISGLVSKEELLAAWKEMESGVKPEPEEIPGRLADIIVQHGIINKWQSQQLLAGRARFTLGQYKIFDSIGHGGMGQVFKARHETHKTVAAIKVLPREKATESAIENFQNEIRALSSLNHPNLVKALGAGIDGNVNYLATEYVPGMDLRKLVRRRGPLRQESAASIIIQAARGLQHAHEAGVVHRDVKPGNILVTMEGLAKLSDLGLSSSESRESQAKIVGTADYISPDQVRNPMEPRPIWDVYSLGCTLYYAVTGRVPYLKGTASEKVKMHLDLTVKPVSPCLINPLISEEFADVIACMMAKNPAERIPSALEAIQFLSPWSDGTPRRIQVTEAEFSQSGSFTRSENEDAFSGATENVDTNKKSSGIVGIQTIPGPPPLPGMVGEPKKELEEGRDSDFANDKLEEIKEEHGLLEGLHEGTRKALRGFLKRFIPTSEMQKSEKE